MKPIIGITSDIDKNRYHLRQDYISSVSCNGAIPLIIPPLKGDIGQIADFIDGLLIPGGDDLSPEYYNEDISVPSRFIKMVRKERSDFEIALLKEVIKRRKPVLGTCYGMQLINVALGGSLYQDLNYQFKGDINHKNNQHAIKIIDDSILKSGYSTFVVNSFHHQAVKGLAKGLKVFAISEKGLVEGFYKSGYPFLVGVQWHPERPIKNTKKKEIEKYDKLSLGIFKSFIKSATK